MKSCLKAKMYITLLIFHILITATGQKFEPSGNINTTTPLKSETAYYIRQRFCMEADTCPHPEAYHQNCVLDKPFNQLCCPDLETVKFIPPGKYVNNDLPSKKIINNCYNYFADRNDYAILTCTLENNCTPNTCMLKPGSLQKNTYKAELGWRRDNGTYHFEGRAVLVARYFLITSAHSMNRGNPDIVHFHELADACEYYDQEIMVNDVYIHPEYKPSLAYNDIAIIKLAEKADERFILYCIWENDNNLVPHSLATYEYNYTDPERLESNTGYRVKLGFDVKTFHELDNTDCNNKFIGDPRLPNGIIHSQLCAGDPEGNIATQGDSSEPLFMEQTVLIKPKRKSPQNIRLIMGIASGQVGVYTRVSSYLEWIDSMVFAPSPPKIELREDELKINSPCFYGTTGQFGTCVHINNCTSAILKLQKTSPQYCFFEENQPIVCCPNDEKISTKVVERNISNRKIINMCYNYYFNTSVGQYGEFDKNCMFQKYPNVATLRKCRDASPGIWSKRVPIQDHMYMASLGWRKDNESYEFRCGAFLVARNFVLTAAHCMIGELPDIVRLGDKVYNDRRFSQDINIARISIHPEYLPQLTYNDIAIIKLAEEAKEQFILACLWVDDADLAPDLEAIGFGATKPNGPTSDELYQVSLQLMNDTVCNAQFFGDYRLPNGVISSQLCAGDPDRKMDTCKGDSGGPLFSKIKLIFAPECNYKEKIAHVLGITSFGPDCAQSLAGGYTRISSYLDWIDSIIFGK